MDVINLSVRRRLQQTDNEHRGGGEIRVPAVPPLIGGPGNGLISGGDGIDTAIFTGSFANHTITTVAGMITITGADGTDIPFGGGAPAFRKRRAVRWPERDQSVQWVGPGQGLGGSAGDDHIFGYGGEDVLNGLQGNDTINGSPEPVVDASHGWSGRCSDDPAGGGQLVALARGPAVR